MPKGLKFQETKVEGQFRTTVVVRRLEAGQFPVDVLVTFSNGEQARETWDGHGRWGVFTFDRPVKAVSAQIDPERRLLLDTNYTNNSRTRSRRPNARRRSGRCAGWCGCRICS